MHIVGYDCERRVLTSSATAAQQSVICEHGARRLRHRRRHGASATRHFHGGVGLRDTRERRVLRVVLEEAGVAADQGQVRPRGAVLEAARVPMPPGRCRAGQR